MLDFGLPSSSAKPKWPLVAMVVGFVVVGAVVGGLIGLLSRDVSAVASIKVGNIESDAGSLEPVQDLATISSFLESPATVASIAKAAEGAETLNETLRPVRFGGLGNLSVREQASFVQIRVRAPTAAVAVKAAAAAANILVDEQNQKITAWKDTLKLALDNAHAEYSRVLGLYERIVERSGSMGEPRDSALINQLVALTALRLIEDTLTGYRQDVARAERDYARAKFQNSQIVSPAAVEFSILAAPSRMAALGGLIGLLVGFIVATFGMLPKLSDETD